MPMFLRALDWELRLISISSRNIAPTRLPLLTSTLISLIGFLKNQSFNPKMEEKL
jgi:hypothetical protein